MSKSVEELNTDCNKELQASCDNVANKLQAIVDGRILFCPSCEGHKEEVKTAPKKTRKKCPHCGETLEAWSIYDYVRDALDVNFTVSARGDYLHGLVCVGFGGPNIYIDTDRRAVTGAWGFDGKARAYLSNDVIEEVDDALESLYGCVK